VVCGAGVELGQGPETLRAVSQCLSGAR